jgi:hypothetical protein
MNDTILVVRSTTSTVSVVDIRMSVGRTDFPISTTVNVRLMLFMFVLPWSIGILGVTLSLSHDVVLLAMQNLYLL